MRTCAEYRTLVSAFLDGELSGEEQAETAEHLASCPACQQYFDDLVAMHDALGQAGEAPVPEGFTAQVMARVRETPQAEEKRIIPFPHWKRWTALAACCAIVMLGLWSARHSGADSAGQTVVARSAPPAACEEDVLTDGGYVTMDDAPCALLMDGEGEAIPEDASGMPPAEDAPQEQKYRDAGSDSLPAYERESAMEPAEYDASSGDADAADLEAAMPAPAAALDGQEQPLSGIVTASGETARNWVEAELGLEWEPGRTYLLTEEEYAGLLDALVAAGEDFRLEPDEGCWLLAE